jgi:integrase
MNVEKVNDKFVAYVDTGKVYTFGRSIGRPIIKRIEGKKRHKVVEKAKKFLNNLNIVKEKEKKQYLSLGAAYDDLEKKWQRKVNAKNKTPLIKKGKGMTPETKSRYEDYAKSLFILLADGESRPNGGFLSKEKKEERNKLEEQGRLIDVNTIDKSFIDKFLTDLIDKESESQAWRVYWVFTQILLRVEQKDMLGKNWVSPHHVFTEDAPTYSSTGGEVIDQKEAHIIRKQILAEFLETYSRESFIMMLMSYTGAYWGEIAALTVADFNFKDFQITFSKSRNSRSGRISLIKAAHLRVQKTKSNTIRIVTVAPETLQFVQKYIEHHKLKMSDYLFHSDLELKNEQKGKLYDLTRTLVIRCCKKAGVNLSATRLFRYFVSTSYTNIIGATRDEKKMRLGHKSDSVQDLYTVYEDPNALEHAKQIAQLYK